MSYSSRHVQSLYKITGETVRTWAAEFSGYLSPTAKPGKGRHRVFSPDDMRVFSYITERKKQGATFEEIHLGLKSGVRGEEPALDPSEMQAIVAGDVEKRLATQIDQLYDALERMKRERDSALEKANTAHEYRDKAIRLETELNITGQRIGELNTQLKDAQKRIEELSKEVGEAYVKGIMETLERKGDLPKKE